MIKYFLLPAIFLFLFILGCSKDDSVSPQFSLETEINAARPYHFVVVFNSAGGNRTFEKGTGGPNAPFDDAYADHGFLFVAGSNDKDYFNLSKANDITIEPDNHGSKIILSY